MLHPLWAIGFSNLVILQAGIAAASIPIVIHLLNRRKHREVPWAAMRFLVAALQRNRRRARVEQWLLLAVRTLLVILVVSAMAKPFLESLGAAALLTGERSHRVLVLDGSLSMAYATAGRSRWDEAKALAGQLVKDARPGDVVSVVVMGDPPRVVIGEASPSANAAEVTREIAGLVLPHGGTNLPASLAAVDRALAASEVARKEVVFLTDLQSASWRKPGQEGPVRRAVARLEARKALSTVIDLGKGGGENRAVVGLRLNAPVVTLGSTDLVATATVKNYGPGPARGTRVRLLVDGQLGPEAPPIDDLAVGAEAAVAFRPKFASAGPHSIEARIDPDPLPIDDHRWMAVPVEEAVNVLLVDGQYKSEAFESETDYLAQALSSATTSEGSASPIRVEVIADSALGRRDLAGFHAIVLCNVASFREAEVAALDAYLKQGGGVVFFGGDQVVADDYNRLLHAGGKGLLPAAIGPPAGDAEAKRAAFDFDPLGFAHPIVRPFADADAAVVAGLVRAKTWKYHKLTLPPGSDAKVALAFAGGDPAVIEAPRHRGRVIQVATTADAGWTTWPLHPSFAPVMEQVVLQAAAGRLAERNVRVGQSLDQVLAAAASGTAAEITRPDKARAKATVAPSGDVSLFHYEGTDLSGTYAVRYAAPGTPEASFSANADPAESDPARLDRASLAEAMPGWKFALVSGGRDLAADTRSVGHHGELHRPFLYGVLALLMIESILAWRFGHHAA